MNSRSRYAALLLLISTFLSFLTPAQAQQNKPVALLSVSSVNGVLDNVSYLTDVAGYAELGQMAALMGRANLQGVDLTKPVGMVVSTDGQQFVPLGFVPVEDLSTVFAALEESIGAPRDLGNGVHEIAGFQPVYIKQDGNYAFVGQTVESMANLPKDPTKMLGKMPQEYDVALRGLVQNIPSVYINMAVSALQDGVKQGLKQLPEEDRVAQEQMIQSQLDQMEAYITESDQITIGWNTSAQDKHTYIDISFTAVPGSDLAKQMNAMAEAKSDYTGFVLPEAAVTLQLTSEIPKEQIQTTIDALDGVKEAALKEIQKDEDIENEDARSAASEMLTSALDILKSTIKTGKMDGAMSVVLEPGDVHLVGGFHVADGKDVEKILRRVADMAKDEEGFPGIEFNADKTDNGVSFHTMTVPIPEGEDARKVLGDSVVFAVGTGATSAYIGFGKDCVSQLKAVIGSQESQKPSTPFELSVALTPIMEFIASLDENPLIGSVADAVAKSADKDHLRLVGIPMKDGFTYRIQLEEGVIRAIGQGVKMATGGAY